MSSDDKKELRDLLKSELGLVALRLLQSALMKMGDETSTAALTPEEQLRGGEEMQRLMEEEEAKRKAAEKPASEEYGDELDSQARMENFLADDQPHPHAKQGQWIGYHVGMNEGNGRPINGGQPFDIDQLGQGLDPANKHSMSGMNPHRIFIRPADRSQGWMPAKGHPSLQHVVPQFTARHEAKLKNPDNSFESGPAASELEHSAHIDPKDFNPQEMGQMKIKHFRPSKL